MTETLLLVVILGVIVVALAAIFCLALVTIATGDRHLVDVLGKAYTGIIRQVARPSRPRTGG